MSALAEDANGLLIVGTNGSGLLQFNGSEFTPIETSENLAGLRIQNLHSGPDGSLWFDDQQRVLRLCPDGNVTSYSGSSLGLPRFGSKSSEPDPLMAPVPLDDGRISVQSSTGMYLFDPDQRQPLKFHYGFYAGRCLPCSNSAYWSCFWGYGALYDGQGRLLSEVAMPVPDGGRCVDPDDNLWIADRQALFRWDGSTLRNYPTIGPALRSTIINIFPDRDGHVWVLSNAGGVGRLRPYPVRALTRDSGLPEGEPLTLRHDPDGRLHVAIRNSFATQTPKGWEEENLDQELTKQTASLQTTAMRRVNMQLHLQHQCLAFAADDSKEVWYGVAPRSDSLVTVRNLSLTFPVPILARGVGGKTTFFCCDALPDGVEWVQSITWTRDQGIWAATEKGILHLIEGKLRNWNDAQGIPQFEAICVFCDQNDTVWLGGYGDTGLYRVNGKEVTRFTAASDGLASDSILCAYEDASGTLWIGGLPGLTRIQDEQIETVNSNHEVFQQPIHAIIEDGLGNLWLGTPTGIFSTPVEAIERVLRRELEELPVIRVGAGDGLPTEALQTDYMPVASRSPEGRLFFCMVDALVSFDPAEMLVSISGPPVRITSALGATEVFLDAERLGPQPANDHLVLPPTAGDLLRVQFSAIDFAYPERDRFHYRLRGVSEQWTDIGNQHQAWFSGLAPGRYQFEVKAYNRNGAVSPQIAGLNFTVLPHYYETWTFRIGVVLTVALAAGVLHRARVRAFRRIEQLEKQVAMDEERSRIA
ncbi:MAG: hypothetical protein H7A46_26790, partial [Verrucomicrobiales bacterium]|nr:hypothetical protein [Verrucomicrobiales bacterium]